MRAFLFPGQGSQTVGMGAALGRSQPRRARSVRGSRRGARPEPVPAHARGARRRAHADRECPAGDHGQRHRGVRGAEQRRRCRSGARRRISSPATALANIPRCARRARSTSPTTAQLLKLRGQAMQAAVPVGVGAMAALLGADLENAQAHRRRRGARAKCARSPTTTTRARSCFRATRARSSARSRWPRTWAPSAACCCRSRRRSTAR